MCMCVCVCNMVLKRAGMVPASAGANNRRKVGGSWLQRPLLSMGSATTLQRRDWRSAGYVRCFARLACWTATPASRLPLVRGTAASIKYVTAFPCIHDIR